MRDLGIIRIGLWVYAYYSGQRDYDSLVLSLTNAGCQQALRKSLAIRKRHVLVKHLAMAV